MNNELKCFQCGCTLDNNNYYVDCVCNNVCANCIDNDYSLCDDGEYRLKEDCVYVYTDGYNNDGCYISIDDDYVIDVDTGDYYFDDTCGCYLPNGDFISQCNYDDNYFTCER